MNLRVDRLPPEARGRQKKGGPHSLAENTQKGRLALHRKGLEDEVDEMKWNK